MLSGHTGPFFRLFSVSERHLITGDLSQRLRYRVDKVCNIDINLGNASGYREPYEWLPKKRYGDRGFVVFVKGKCKVSEVICKRHQKVLVDLKRR